MLQSLVNVSGHSQGDIVGGAVEQDERNATIDTTVVEEAFSAGGKNLNAALAQLPVEQQKALSQMYLFLVQVASSMQGSAVPFWYALPFHESNTMWPWYTESFALMQRRTPATATTSVSRTGAMCSAPLLRSTRLDLMCLCFKHGQLHARRSSMF